MYAASTTQAVLRVNEVSYGSSAAERHRRSQGFQDFVYSLTPSAAQRRLGAVTVRLIVSECDDGHRRFFPTDAGYATLVEKMARFGFALLAQREHFDRFLREQQRGMLAAFLSASHLQEFITFRPTAPSRLTISSAYQGPLGRSDLLPSELGRSTPDDVRWSLDTVVRTGREAAEEDGRLHPDDRQSLTYGWCESARRAPLHGLGSAEIASAIRRAIFDFSQVTESLTATQEVAFRTRFHVLEQRHRRRNSGQPLMGGHSNLIRDLASATYAVGPHRRQLGRDLARRGLLDLVWQAYFQVAQALEECAVELERHLDLPFTELERRYFEATFYRQTYLGQLSLLLIAPRCGLLHPLLAPIWANPDDEGLIAALHRALEQFAETASAVRELERLKKRGLKGALPMPDELDAQTLKRSFTSELFEDALERRDVVCVHCYASPSGQLISGTNGCFQVEATCAEHGPIGIFELSLDELKKAAENISESSGNFARPRQDKPKKPR